jgi:hypothetical protein
MLLTVPYGTNVWSYHYVSERRMVVCFQNGGLLYCICFTQSQKGCISRSSLRLYSLLYSTKLQKECQPEDAQEPQAQRTKSALATRGSGCATPGRALPWRSYTAGAALAYRRIPILGACTSLET